MDIDLNADVGEGFGCYSIGDDAALMKIVSSANVACGYHAGDPVIMETTWGRTLASPICSASAVVRCSASRRNWQLTFYINSVPCPALPKRVEHGSRT